MTNLNDGHLLYSFMISSEQSYELAQSSLAGRGKSEELGVANVLKATQQSDGFKY